MAQPNKRVDSKGRKLPDGFSQRRDGRYQARFTFNSKRYTLYDINLINLKNKVIEKKNELNNGIYGSLDDVTLNIWFDKWMKVYKYDKLKKSTYENYKNYYKWYISDTIGGMKIKNIKRTHLISLYNELLKRDKPLAGSTLKYIHNIVYSLFKQAYLNDLIRKNPAEDILKEILIPDNKKREALTCEEQHIFLEFIEENRFYSKYKPMFIVAFGTGMRIGELTALTWSDIDMVNETISINKTLKYTRFITENGNYYLINTPKTKSSMRVIPMLPEVKAALILQKKYQEMLEIKSNIIINGYKDFVFTTLNKRPYTPEGINIELRRMVNTYNNIEESKAKEEKREAIILRNFSPHIIRHTFATRCFENGIDTKVVQTILGHAKINTTMDIYTDCSVEEARKNLDRFKNFFK